MAVKVNRPNFHKSVVASIEEMKTDLWSLIQWCDDFEDVDQMPPFDLGESENWYSFYEQLEHIELYLKFVNSALIPKEEKKTA